MSTLPKAQRKYLLTVCCVLIGFFSSIRAQTSDSIVFVQQPTNVTVSLWSIIFADTLHGWAAGDTGTLLRTVDGGKNWLKPAKFTSRNISSVCFINPAVGWLTTDTAQIYKSIDSGVSWSLQFFPSRSTFGDCIFFDDSTGFASGSTMNGANMYNNGIIYKTVNGGKNWTLSASYLITVSGIGSLSFPDKRHGWTTGMDYLLKTTDIGQTWQTPVEFYTIADSAFVHSNGYVNMVYFKDTLNGFGIGRYGHILRTRNGGTSWNLAAKFTPWLESICFADQSHGIIAGERGAVLVSSDSGANWSLHYPRQQPTMNAPWFRSLFFLNTDNGWICGDSGIIMKGSFYRQAASVKASQVNSDFPSNDFRICKLTNACMTIAFSLIKADMVSIDMYDLAGNRIQNLLKGYRTGGTFTEQFTLKKSLHPGTYIVVMHGTYQNNTLKMDFVR